MSGSGETTMCEQREQILDYLYNESAPADRRVIEQHLEACDTCRADVTAFRRVREDLLAWDVPEQTSVWTPFAPVPVVPWHRQVPAWAMAAAASVMFVMGAAGSYAMSTLTGQPTSSMAMAAVASAPVLTPAPVVDSALVGTLVRQELRSAGFDALRQATPVSVSAPMTARLDVATEQRLLANAEAFVGASEGRQWSRIQTYLSAVASEQNAERRRDGESISSLATEVMELRETVKQLLAAQQSRVQ
jgi:anti-sigma factor RsiW